MTSFLGHDQHVMNTMVAIASAYLLALPLGWERKVMGTTHVGLRTVPMVSVGTCAYLLLSRYLFERGIFDSDGEARALRAMMTGIGFIGGGAILKAGTDVRGVAGMTTATSIWTTGAIGAAVAYGHYVVAVVLTMTVLVVVELTGKLTAHARSARERLRRRHAT